MRKFAGMLPALSVAAALALSASPAFSKQEGKTKAKGGEASHVKENSGRQAGELPAGLQRYSEKGALPGGLQKMKEEDGHLTRGLEKGGKKLEPNGKAKKITK
jgi:hypothetical protein